MIKRMRDKSLSCLFRAIQITARELRSAYVQLTRDPDRNRLERVIEYIDLRVEMGLPIGGNFAQVPASPSPPHRRQVRLRRAVVIVERATVKPLKQACDVRRNLQLLTGGDHLTQTRKARAPPRSASSARCCKATNGRNSLSTRCSVITRSNSLASRRFSSRSSTSEPPAHSVEKIS